jgi:hypothetical protein
MRKAGQRRTTFFAAIAFLALSTGLLLACATNSRLQDVADIPRGHSVVLAVPTVKGIAAKTLFREQRTIYYTLQLTFQNIASTKIDPVYLVLRGDATNDIQAYTAPPGTYRLVWAHVPDLNGWGRWEMDTSPYELRIEPGEVVYVGHLYLRGSFLKIVASDSEATKFYTKFFNNSGLKFKKRLVKDPHRR